MLEAHLRELSHPLNDYRIRAQRFLEAWKRGVTLIGTRFFEIKSSSGRVCYRQKSVATQLGPGRAGHRRPEPRRSRVSWSDVLVLQR